MTTQIGRVYPSEALVTLNDGQRKAMADQLTTVSKQHLIDKVGSLTHEPMRKVEHVVRIQLGLLDTDLQA